MQFGMSCGRLNFYVLREKTQSCYTSDGFDFIFVFIFVVVIPVAWIIIYCPDAPVV